MRPRLRRPGPTTVVIAGLLTIAILGALLVAATAPAAAQSSSVTITNVTTSPSTPTVDETFVVRVRIANAQNAEGSLELNNVYVLTPSGRSSIARDLGTLSPGSATTVRIPVTIDEPGWHTLTARVHGQDSSNQVVIVDHPVPVQVRGDQTERLSMAASAHDVGPSGRTDLEVAVANGFEDAITGVDLQVTSPDLTLPESQRVASQIPPGNTTRFSFPIRDARPGQHAVTTRIAYTRPDGERRTVVRNLTTEIAAVSEPGRIRLTEIDVTRDGDQLVVRGSTANDGTTDVSGVTVTVEESETAGPAEGSSTFFVGNVPASDFSSFDVSAEPRANGTVTIPLNVSYVVDGVRTHNVVEVTHRVSADSGASDGDASGGGLSLVTIVGALAIVGGLVFGWRRYRG